jgi:hypothetical protein
MVVPLYFDHAFVLRMYKFLEKCFFEHYQAGAKYVVEHLDLFFMTLKI